MSIDEAIEKESKIAKENQKIVDTQIVFYNVSISELYCDDTEVIEEHLSNYTKCAEYHEQIAEWLEELKVIKKIDLSIPQHFTKEQSDWIKKYCINRNKEFYNKALYDFVKFANTMPTIESEDGEIRPMWLEEMAEKLKVGGKDNDD